MSTMENKNNAANELYKRINLTVKNKNQACTKLQSETIYQKRTSLTRIWNSSAVSTMCINSSIISSTSDKHYDKII